MDQAPNASYSTLMIGFLIKKTFYDLWDNLFRIAFINLGFLASFAIPSLIPPLFIDYPVIAFAIMIIGALWCFIYLAMAALNIRALSDYGSFGFKDFFRSFKQAWPAGLFFGAFSLVLVGLAYIALPFYLQFGSLLGVFAAALVFWTMMVLMLAAQYFYPVRGRLDTKLRKVIKKSFIIFFDNPGFSIFILFHNLVLFVISFFLAFLAPGPGGILLFLDEALRLRLRKYDYLEEYPEANRKKIPWEELIAEDREKTGTRSIKSLLFPWKD